MKKLLFFSSIIALFLSGCSIYPDADFSVNRTRVQPDEYVYFTNYSDNAVRYDWDFGDGTYSSEINPRHSFYDEGLYTVTLTAESRDGKIDRATIRIEVIYTLLEITVAKWNEDEVIRFAIPDALVILYFTLDDWYDDVNEVVWGYTDYQGDITFAGLEDRHYFVWAERVYNEGDGYNNYAFYEEYLDSYLMTPVLEPFALNIWTAWVDYYNPYKSSKESRIDKYAKDKIKSEDPSFIIVDESK